MEILHSLANISPIFSSQYPDLHSACVSSVCRIQNWVQSWGICLSVPFVWHLALGPLVFLCAVSTKISPVQGSVIFRCVSILNFLWLSSLCEYSDCFLILAIVNDGIMNTGVQKPLQHTDIFCCHILNGGIASFCSHFICTVLWSCHTVVHKKLYWILFLWKGHLSL